MNFRNDRFSMSNLLAYIIIRLLVIGLKTLQKKLTSASG